MFKRNVIAVLILLIGAIGMSALGASLVHAQDGTVPTRTPTPDPNRPTRINPTATRNDPGNSPSSTATATSSSPTAPTATGTRPATGQSTVTLTAPAAGIVTGGTSQTGAALPGTCDETPHVRAIVQLTAYAGPGTDYTPLTTLEPEEMRRITGRAANAAWWLVQLDAATVGWVQDRDVDEFGNTALVAIVETPLRNGATTTPGALWNPTPLPLLTCVPTPTPSATPTGTHVPPAAGAGSGSLEAAPTTGSEQPAGPTPEQPVTGTGDNGTTQQGIELPPGPGVSSRGSESSRAASPTSTMNLILPIAGLALIGGGILLALLSRKRGGNQETPPR